MIGAVIRHLLYFSLSRILMKISTKESSKKSWGRWFSLSILPISSVYVISAIRIITDGLVLNLSDLMVIVTSTVLLMFANIIVYYIYEQAEKSSQKLLELEMTNQKNDIDLQYLNLLEKKNETMQIMIHDYKNHMMTIEAMSDSSKVNEYIENMLGEISKYSQMGKTKNKILDVILSKYTEICADKQIEFEVNIMSDNLSFISDTDISSLFNNILDNAVESAENSTDKLINLQISNSLNSYHKIVAINSCDNQPNSKNGKLISTKNNKDIHGFGTKSIEKIVNNYNGEAQWKYDDIKNQFELMILIPIEQ
jgi:sensor histidine kinase YesM